jgi:hypothetical protein
VEFNLDDFTRIRFGQDKRLDEVARMLQSSEVPTVRMVERPELRCASDKHAPLSNNKIDPRPLSTANMTRPRNNRTMSSESQKGRFLYP